MISNSNSDIIVDIPLEQPSNANNLVVDVSAENDSNLEQPSIEQEPISNNNLEDHKYVITSYEQYSGYISAILEYEDANLRYNISSMLFMPIFLVIKIVTLVGRLAKTTLAYTFKTVVFTLFFIEAMIRRYYETFINIYGIVALPICMRLNIESMTTTILLSICLFNYTRFLFINKYLLANIVGTLYSFPEVNPNRKKLFIFSQVVHNALLFINLVLTRDNSNQVYIWLLVVALVSQLIYYSMFPYYLKYRCTNIVWLERYGLKDRVDAVLDSMVKCEIDRLLPLVATKHTCDTNYNGLCSKCPCAICYDNLDEITTLKCGHIFHIKCIRQTAIYEYQKYKKVECPACRTKLI
jgi:hypothetical protein